MSTPSTRRIHDDDWTAFKHSGSPKYAATPSTTMGRIHRFSHRRTSWYLLKNSCLSICMGRWITANELGQARRTADSGQTDRRNPASPARRGSALCAVLSVDGSAWQADKEYNLHGIKAKPEALALVIGERRQELHGATASQTLWIIQPLG